MAEIMSKTGMTGLRNAIFKPYVEHFDTRFGKVALSFMVVATNDSVKNKYAFCLSVNQEGETLKISGDKQIKIFDSDNNCCVAVSGYCPEAYCTRLQGYSNAFSRSYVISCDDIKKLKLIGRNASSVTIETDSMDFQYSSSYLARHLCDCIEKAEKELDDTFMDYVLFRRRHCRG